MRFEYINCNICGSKNSKFLGKRKSPDNNPKLETKIVKCGSCGLIYPNPMPVAEKKEIQHNFSNAESYFPGGITKKSVEKCGKTIRRIEKILGGKGRFLDVGCGRGEMVYAASKEGWGAVGSEISPDFADYAKRTFGANILVGDINSLGFERESLDAACLNSVIQYVPDPMETLKGINRLLKKNGLLYIETTNEDALIFTAADLFKSLSGGEKNTTHLSPLFPSFQIYGFNKKSLSRALRSAGYEPIFLKVKGLRGGGKIKGSGITNIMVNLTRMIIISIGGMIGKGHLLYCIARKR